MDNVEENQMIMVEEMKLLVARQDEMYLILKGWEEGKQITTRRLDELSIEMAKMKSHKHKIVIETKDAATL